MTPQEAIFDTRIDTNKIYVSINTNFSLHNYIDKDGKAALYLHITGGSKRERLNLDIKVPVKGWLKSKQRLKPVTKLQRDINLIIDNVDAKITNIKTVYRLSELHLTPLKLKDELINDMPRTNFISFFEKMLEYEKINLRIGTYRRHRAVCRKLKKYQPEVFFNEINEVFFSNFKTYLKAKGNKSTTIAGNILSIKKFLLIAIKSGIKIPCDLSAIKSGKTTGNRTALNPEELKRVFLFFESEFINPNYKLILGYFLFSCMTGLRFSDIMKLKRPSKKAVDIDFLTIKTSKVQIISLNNKSKEIIEAVPNLFINRLTNEYINRELKKIMIIIGVTKKVSFHVSRHTFATTYLRMGGKIEKLRILLGHSSINQTMIYEHIVASEANESIFLMDKLWD